VFEKQRAYSLECEFQILGKKKQGLVGCNIQLRGINIAPAARGVAVLIRATETP
jgi:hypothetical protein